MSRWPRFQDPLYRLFDWPKRSETSDDLWFGQLMRDRSRVYYAVDNEDRELIGRISLREKNKHKSARLGIGFGPDYVAQGYGTEALSVILQVGSFRMRGKRIFRMSPLHHHFELSGWSETKVVIRFWIIAIIFALLALATLKLR